MNLIENYTLATKENMLYKFVGWMEETAGNSTSLTTAPPSGQIRSLSTTHLSKSLNGLYMHLYKSMKNKVEMILYPLLISLKITLCMVKVIADLESTV